MKRKPTAAPKGGFPIPALKKGEVYAGVLVEAGKPKHHLVLLPGDESKNWAGAGAWAKKKGGTLPTRKEQALLFANAADKFQPRWYWSSEAHASDADCAWCQNFGYGSQFNDLKSNVFRCRAVRRVAI